MKIICFFLIFISVNCFAKTIDDLGYKEVFRNFYPEMFRASMDEDDFTGSDYPKVGIKEKNKEYLAIMHPVQEYKNTYGQDRFLVFIEKREIDKNVYTMINGKYVKSSGLIYGFSNTCHACYGKADLMIFKKTNTNKYELVSTSAKNYEPAGRYGIVSLDTSNLAQKVIKVSDNSVGFFNEISDFHYGTETRWLDLTILGEDQINNYPIDISGTDNSGNEIGESPLSFTLTSEWSVSEVNGSQSHYPIKIKFSGDTFDEKLDKIIKYNKINTYEFINKSTGYKLTSSADY